jgi:dephospho-CoA kinase
MVYSVGLTGNIACGKSTVAHLFNELGTPIYSADNASRELTQPHEHAYQTIVHHFGSTAVREDGTLDRAYLRDLIFTHPKERAWLEDLLHPLIRLRLEEQVRNCSSDYCLVEIPLLFDKSLYPYLNEIILVTCSPELQVSRVMERDGCSEEKARAVLNAQPSLAQRLKLADEVIHNDGGLDALKAQVEKLHQAISLRCKAPLA